MAGEYKIEVIGIETGDYTLSYVVVFGEDEIYSQEYTGTIVEGEVLVSTVTSSTTPTGEWTITSTPPSIPAVIDFDPDTLNLKSKGELVTVYIELPVGHGYDVSQINLGSIRLNGQIQAETKPTQIGDYDFDGIPDLMVKFKRAAVQSILEVSDQVEITITGEVTGGKPFEGTVMIRVIEK
jgi:hypothetical protein